MSIRVIHDPPLAGATNMARDEALLSLVGELEAPPTLRIYQWEPPTISLRYFQPYAEYATLPPPAGALPVVRRLTGGGAILHDRELTYSLTLPTGHPLVAPGPNRLYELAHDAIMACLADLGTTALRCDTPDESGPARGPFFCFARRHRFDLLIGDDKIAGSAQRRTRKAVLQHGSIVLENRFPQQPTSQVRGAYTQSVADLRSSLSKHFEHVTGQRFEPGLWCESDRARWEELVAKYAGTEWTRRT